MDQCLDSRGGPDHRAAGEHPQGVQELRGRRRKPVIQEDAEEEGAEEIADEPVGEALCAEEFRRAARCEAILNGFGRTGTGLADQFEDADPVAPGAHTAREGRQKTAGQAARVGQGLPTAVLSDSRPGHKGHGVQSRQVHPALQLGIGGQQDLEPDIDGRSVRHALGPQSTPQPVRGLQENGGMSLRLEGQTGGQSSRAAAHHDGALIPRHRRFSWRNRPDGAVRGVPPRRNPAIPRARRRGACA